MNKMKAHASCNNFNKRISIIMSCIVASLIISHNVQAEYMGAGAGIGALLGLALSDGYYVEDVIADTVVERCCWGSSWWCR